MLAILENAVEYFQKYVLAQKGMGQKLFQEAEEWFLDKNCDELFSFESICEIFGLHPDYIRHGLMSWKGARRKEHSLLERRWGRQKLAKARVAHTSLRFSRSL